MSSGNNCIVAADLRWPDGTGIGLCQVEHLARVPKGISIKDIKTNCKIGSPLSPFVVGYSLNKLRENCSVFWSPGFIPPAYSRIPSVVTVHDLTHLHFYSALHARYYDFVLRPLYRNCSAIICVSEYTRNEFLDWSGASPANVHVIYNGVSNNYHSNVLPYSPGYPYIFYPGNKRIYKNLNMLLRAFKNSTLSDYGVKLIMTGSATPELLLTIADLKLGEHVVFLGFVSDTNLPSIYRGAEFTVFISLYEGFGLPIVESMAVGTPVLTSNISSMPEVAGDAAQLVDPNKLDEITATMEKLLFDNSLRKDLSALGLRRAEFFSWDKSSDRTWTLLQHIGHSRLPSGSSSDGLAI